MANSETPPETPSFEEQLCPNGECFVIMPISDPEGYERGHFLDVYQQLLSPACEMAGFSPIRADEVRQTNLIHHDILQRLLETPMALCDLSSRNPNVLFELGIRQAFDKPVVLVGEENTPQIFDIGPLRTMNYHVPLLHKTVPSDQAEIAKAITETFNAAEAGEGVNSLVRLLSLNKAAGFVDLSGSDRDLMLERIETRLAGLEKALSGSRKPFAQADILPLPEPTEYETTLGHITVEVQRALRLARNARLHGTQGSLRLAQSALLESDRAIARIIRSSPDLRSEDRATLGDLQVRILREMKALQNALEGG